MKFEVGDEVMLVNRHNNPEYFGLFGTVLGSEIVWKGLPQTEYKLALTDPDTGKVYTMEGVPEYAISPNMTVEDYYDYAGEHTKVMLKDGLFEKCERRVEAEFPGADKDTRSKLAILLYHNVLEDK